MFNINCREENDKYMYVDLPADLGVRLHELRVYERAQFVAYVAI